MFTSVASVKKQGSIKNLKAFNCLQGCRMKQFEVIGFGALNMDKLYRVNKITTADEEIFSFT